MAIVEQFETAWRGANACLPEIERFLPQGDHGLRREVLAELIPIDLEYRWRRAGKAGQSPRPETPRPNGHAPSTSQAQPRPWLLDDYLARYPELGSVARAPLDLVGHEYRVRCRWGDRPTHEEFLARFPGHGEALLIALQGVDAEQAPADSSVSGSSDRPGSGTYGRYQIKGLLGQGGIGRVWLAYDQQLKRDVAIKEILPELATDGGLRARFLFEAEITARLQHPGVMPIRELASRADTNQSFYVMPYIQGQTLSTAIKAYHAQRTSGTAQRRDLVRLLDALIAVCSTIEFAHSHLVIHSAAQGPQPNLTSRIATVRGCAQSRCYASAPRRSRL
jgi:hypothetical protein